MAFAALKKNAVALIAASTLLCTGSAVGAAEIKFRDVDLGSYAIRWISVEGEIESGDFIKLSAAFDTKHLVTMIDFWSPGGDVDEAIKIAELMNDKLPLVNGPSDDCRERSDLSQRNFPRNPKNCVCYSACAIIWLTAAKRHFGQNVGVHRARFKSEYFAGLSAAEAEKKYRYLLNQLTVFLTAHDVPQVIVEKMNTTPSNDIYVLSADDIEQVGETRPFLAELLQARCNEFIEVANEIRSLDKEVERLWAAITKRLDDAERALTNENLSEAQRLVDETYPLTAKRKKLEERRVSTSDPYSKCLFSNSDKLTMQAQGVASP